MIGIDINCDVGEGIENEEQLMPYISSCNIACGGHAGNTKSIDDTIALALKHHVKIGAHPSFPDIENFGRKVLDISASALQKSIKDQIGLIQERLRKVDEKLHHIKAHGALYNLSAIDENTATVLVKAVQQTTADVFLYVPYNSVIEKVALANGQKVIYEAFADRNYNNDLSLVSRVQKNAVITDANEVFKHVYQMISQQKVTTIFGDTLYIKASTYCIHGDNPNAIALLKHLVISLKEKEIQVY